MSATTASAATDTRSESDHGGGPQLSHRQILEVLSGLMLGMFLAALDQTIVASAIRTIGDDLHGLSVQAWVTTAYLVTATISTPLYGKLADIYGRKLYFLTAISIFVIGGFFAGTSSILTIDGWRWVFLVNVPIGIIALAVVAKVLNVPHIRRPHRIDWLGALTITIGLVPLLTVAEQGREWGWDSRRAIICYSVGAAGLLAFIAAEARAREEALIPLRMFRNGTFSLTAIVGIITGMGMFGVLVSLPLYLQIVRGATPTESGLLL